jgi:hypothetical protein
MSQQDSDDKFWTEEVLADEPPNDAFEWMADIPEPVAFCDHPCDDYFILGSCKCTGYKSVWEEW